MIDDFLVRALLAGLGVAAATGPLGAFVVWRRMAYFGEALANAALLGVAVSTLARIDPTIGVTGFMLGLALILTLVERQRLLPTDTVLSILAHGALALGLVALAFLERVRLDLMAWLFGDVLAVSGPDLALIGIMLTAVAASLAAFWRPLLSLTVDPDLAAVEGVPVARLRLLLTLLLAGVIAVGMKVVGMLLVVALLVVPAAAARRLARTPEQMAILAAAVGAGAVALGLALSLRLDLPAGPAIVTVAVAVLALTSLARRPLAPTDG